MLHKEKAKQCKTLLSKQGMLSQDGGDGKNSSRRNLLQRRAVVYFIFADCGEWEKRRRMRGKDEGPAEERKENKRGKGSLFF